MGETGSGDLFGDTEFPTLSAENGLNPLVLLHFLRSASYSAVFCQKPGRHGHYPPRPPTGLKLVAWVGSSKTSHTRCSRFMVSAEAQSRRPMTQLLRFNHPATAITSMRKRFILAVRSCGSRHRLRMALTRL